MTNRQYAIEQENRKKQLDEAAREALGFAFAYMSTYYELHHKICDNNLTMADLAESWDKANGIKRE